MKLLALGLEMTRCFYRGAPARQSLANVAAAALLVAVGLFNSDAQAASEDSHHVKASLVSETQNIVAGKPLRLALRQQVEPGWHTYWSNPGEAGLPTTIDWRLPQGFKAGAITWPTPERFRYGPVVGYGYTREVLLPVTLDVPPDLHPGTTVTLSAHASWLVCAEDCIPEDAELSITLPVGGASEANQQWAGDFASTFARTPAPNPFRTVVEAIGERLSLRVETGDATHLREVAFFPLERGAIDDAAPQRVAADAEGLTVLLERERAKPEAAALNGVLIFTDSAVGAEAATTAILISAPVDRPPASAFPEIGVVAALLLAFGGGIILNLMPCVLPVLSIKVFGLVQHPHATPAQVRMHGVAYAAGVLASFAAIAAALMGLRATGAEIGWGFQLQSPPFVAVMIYILFAVGLNLSGAFSIGFQLASVGSDLSSRPGYAGSFFTGALATVVATPCTAPFMASAIGFAVTQPWYVSAAVFEALGLGLAFPFLLVTAVPAMHQFLPKPGVWMLRLKQFLAFPVYATAVWLLYVLSQEAGESAVSIVLVGAVMIAFGAWLYDAAWSSGNSLRNWAVVFSAATVLGAFALLGLVNNADSQQETRTTDDSDAYWQPFSHARLDELRAEGKPIFIDFTATWCITCKVNERLVLSDPAVRKALANADVAMLRADWTRQDPEITREIEANGRLGVPLYLFYPKPISSDDRPSPIILPQILTADSLLREVRNN